MIATLFPLFLSGLNLVNINSNGQNDSHQRLPLRAALFDKSPSHPGICQRTYSQYGDTPLAHCPRALFSKSIAFLDLSRGWMSAGV